MASFEEFEIDQTGPDFMLENLEEYMNGTDFADVEIVCNGGVVLAHCAVLAAASPFLKGLFASPDIAVAASAAATTTPDNIHITATVLLPDVSEAVVKQFLQLVYCGEVTGLGEEQRAALMGLLANLKVSEDIQEILQNENEIDNENEDRTTGVEMIQDVVDDDDEEEEDEASMLLPETEMVVDEHGSGAWMKEEEDDDDDDDDDGEPVEVNPTVEVTPVLQPQPKKARVERPVSVKFELQRRPVQQPQVPPSVMLTPVVPPPPPAQLLQISQPLPLLQPSFLGGGVDHVPSRQELDERTREMLDTQNASPSPLAGAGANGANGAGGRKCERCRCPNCMDPNRKVERGEISFHLCHYPECSRVYKKTSHLRAHLRSHIGDQPYMCSWENCGKRFTRSDELHRHFRIHTGEKNHKCMVCHKTFSRSDHLKKHMASHNSPGPKLYAQ